MGAVTPLAIGVDESWKKLSDGESGIKRISCFDTSGLKCRVAGEIPDFEPKEFMPKKQVRRTDRFVHFLLAATRMAMEDSRFRVGTDEEYRVGVIAGTAIGACNTFESNHQHVVLKEPNKVSPTLVINLSANTAGGHIANEWKARGPHHFIQEACAAGTNAIGLGLRTIQHEEADVMILGGADAGICTTLIASLDNLGALVNSYWNEEPQKASRPFEKNRSGFVTAEGAGAVILEELDHARERGAHIYAEVMGYGSTCDAYHPVAPLPSGESARHCMEIGIKDSGIRPEDIDYINAHGTSTPANDITETLAIKSLFGARAKDIPVSSNKSMIGHMWGAAGVVEAIFTVKSLINGLIPPTINLVEKDPECDLDYVPNIARKADIRTALSNSFGFGGINGCVVLRRYGE